MARVTPQEAADKWSRRTSAATQDYTAGVNRVSTAPGQAAAAQQDKLVNNFNAAVQSGKWKAGVASVSLQAWQQATVTKGAPRLATGVQNATPKMTQFMNEFLPFLDGVTARTKAMPSTTIEQRMQRAMAQMQGTATFKRRG